MMKKLVSLLLLLATLCGAIPAMAAEPLDDPEITTYPASMYKVGADIPEGEYLAIAEEDAIISAVFVQDSSSSDANIGFMSIFDTFTIVGVRKGEYIDVSGAYLIPLEQAKVYIENYIVDGIRDGSYKVGDHIPEGEYRYTADAEALLPTITTYTDPYQEDIDDMIIPDGRGYIYLQEGQYVYLSGVTLTLLEE
jgi:hypothetical protein